VHLRHEFRVGNGAAKSLVKAFLHPGPVSGDCLPVEIMGSTRRSVDSRLRKGIFESIERRQFLAPGNADHRRFGVRMESFEFFGKHSLHHVQRLLFVGSDEERFAVLVGPVGDGGDGV